MENSESIEICGRKLRLNTGEFAKQADGSVMVQYGDTIVLVSAVSSKDEGRENDFFPLTVNYMERTYAAGKIPGGFFKREGRPREKEILSSRMIDRPIRPLFEDGFVNETQVVAMVLSADQENDSDILGIIGASAALTVSDIPFNGPIGAVRIGLVNGEFIINPTFSQLNDSRMDVVIVANGDSIVMIEGGCMEVNEVDVMKAIELAIPITKKIIDAQERLRQRIGVKKRIVSPVAFAEGFEDRIAGLLGNEINRINGIKIKALRNELITNLQKSICETLSEEFPDSETAIIDLIDEYRKKDIREKIIKGESRLDGRGPEDIRPIGCKAGILPRVHGSALFTRGETQSLCTVSLGTTTDQQRVEDLEGQSVKSFMLHYNFMPFSVGEARPMRGPGRREIGHGALAEKAIEPVLPIEERFPYTIRIVSDILESNGSSSMASVCGSSLALMDAGVPIKTGVAGISVGLVKGKDGYVILSDIIGDEDHFGDMDFKVAGTRAGITAIQLDTKVCGLDSTIISEALERAKQGRYYILDIMDKTLKEHRTSLSDYAPKVIVMTVPKEKIGEIIGPGGRVIRKLIEETGCEIEISDDGKVSIIGSKMDSVENAEGRIKSLIQEVEAGNTFDGKVTRITNFGAFVEIMPGKEGLVHISQLAHHRVSRVEDEVKVGDEIKVLVREVDDLGRINLSRKAMIEPSSSEEQEIQRKKRNNDKYKKKQPAKWNHDSHRKS